MNSTFILPAWSTGVGLRPPHYSRILAEHPDLPWLEATSENFLDLELRCRGRPVEILEELRERYPVALHGVSLSIGSADPLDRRYLAGLKELVGRIEPEIVSDHLCWTGVDGENLHDLLPLPYTREALEHLVSRISEVQELLGRPILLENVSAYAAFASSEMTEWDFLAELSRRSGCGILLDINNIYVSSASLGFRAEDFVDGIPRGSVGYFHLAGHSDLGTHLIDTHDRPVSGGVWRLYERALRRFGPVPAIVEWDGNIPGLERLREEARESDRIREKVFGKKRTVAPSARDSHARC